MRFWRRTPLRPWSACGWTGVAGAGQLHALEDRLRVGARGCAGALDELRAGGEVGVGVRLDEVALAVARQAEVDTRVVAEPERLEGDDGGALHRLAHVVRELRHPDLAAAIGARAFRPLHLGARDAGRALRKVREVELDGRQGFRLVVAEHARVDLPTVDVLLDKHGVVEL